MMHRPCVTVVAGLPGSGKTPFARELEESGCVLFDDYRARAYDDSPRFASGRRYGELLDALREGRHCAVLDSGFCRADTRLEAERVLRQQVPGIVVEWRFFANDSAQCEANIGASDRPREPRLKLLGELAPEYGVPEGVVVLPVRRPE